MILLNKIKKKLYLTILILIQNIDKYKDLSKNIRFIKRKWNLTKIDV